MIRTLTIIENRKENGIVEYSANGSFPIDEAAKALVIIAYQSIPPTKNGDIISDPKHVESDK
jgi:hypothetical protein